MARSTSYANPRAGSTVTLQIQTTNTGGLCTMKYAAKGQRHFLYSIHHNYEAHVQSYI
jgi:hypothetical protein